MRMMIAVGAALLALAGPAWAQHQHERGMEGRESAPGRPALTQPGQGGFAAIQEIVDALASDPTTDWTRVNIDQLREHLIDMDEVALRAEIQREEIEGGLRFRVTGAGRTRAAIQRMVMAHVRSMGDAPHWTMTADEIAQGVLVTVRPKGEGDLVRIRALGLIGMMAEGAHHQTHHGFLATGVAPPGH